MDLNQLRDVPGSEGPKPEIAKYKLISADSHICEPPSLYKDYIDPKFRDRAPHTVQGDRGELFMMEGIGKGVGLGVVAAAGRDPRDIYDKYNTFEDLHPGCWDPHQRLAAQDADGVLAEIQEVQGDGLQGRLHARRRLHGRGLRRRDL
jgi:hypothetical protein